jgi:hypothetical protein
MINEKLEYFNINSNKMVLSPENGKQFNQKKRKVIFVLILNLSQYLVLIF